jgi:outer membrane protein
MKRLWTMLASALLTGFAATPAAAVDLLGVYEDALGADPTLREAAANRMATLESKPQALAALLPQITGQYTYSKSWASGNSTFTQGVDTSNPPDGQLDSIITGSTGFSQTTDPRKFWQLQLTQTLFRWDQWVTLRQADKQLAQAEATYRAAEQDLMIRASQRYFDILGANATLSAAEAAKEAIGRQLEQAEKRFEVGLIAITDVQETQASYDQAVADVISVKRQVATAREFLREITGEYYEQLADAGPDIPLIPPNPADVEAWVQTALSNNLSLEASRLGAEIAHDNVSIRRSGHMPTLDFFANRSNDDRDADRQDKPQQSGANILPEGPADSDIWNDTIGLQLNVPIYSGGSVKSQSKQAVFEHRASREQLERVARETERQVRDSFLSVDSEISRVNALARSVESNETALRATEAGFEVGTRTTVDVLDARRNLFGAQRDYARSRYDYVVNALLLKQAAGNLSADDLREVDGWLEE